MREKKENIITPVILNQMFSGKIHVLIADSRHNSSKNLRSDENLKNKEYLYTNIYISHVYSYL